MNMKRLTILASVVAVTAVVLAIKFYLDARGLRADAKIGHTYCLATRHAAETSHRMFEHGSLDEKEHALSMLKRPMLWAGQENWEECLGHVPELPVECVYRHDWACLDEVASGVADEFRRRGY